MRSQNVVISAPMSYTGSAKRLWRLTRLGPTWLRWALTIWLTVALVAVAWAAVTVWYVCAGWLMIPYRMIRRSQRRQRRDALALQERLTV